MNKLQRFRALLSCALLAACSSTGAKSEEPGLLVVLRDFRTGARFELASQSHTDRVAYYSNARTDAARKVQTDEVMAAFVEGIEGLGFEKHAQSGRAPTVASGDVIRWGLELERGAQKSHWLVGTGSSPADWKEFQDCREAFLVVYNQTDSYQAVQNPQGKGYFEERSRDASKKR